MSAAFHLGGWGMYPTSVMGLVLLGAAGLYARRPERGGLPVVIGFAVMTFLAGSLGFVTGVIKTLAYAASSPPPEGPGVVVAAGISESLHNISLALVLLVLASIVTTVGTIRARRVGPAGIPVTPRS